jgi:multidrug efflux pump subunit AcrA (membrane-fusion protein)
MNAATLALQMLMVLGPLQAPYAPEEAPTEFWVLTLLNEAQVPAEEAGVLVELPATEGRQVATGDLLARIDDVTAKMAVTVAGLNLDVANEQANDDVNVRHAKAAAEVAQAEYQKAWEANKRAPGSYSEIELRKLGLEWKRASLAIEKAQMEQKVAGLQAKVKEAEKDAATENLQRRRIESPLDGVVVDVYRHVGEWVQPGDPVLHVIRLDRLRVQGTLSRRDTAAGAVVGREVSVAVELERGRKESFDGSVVFADPSVQADGRFRVIAEVENRQENGHWILGPGMKAEAVRFK